MSENPGIDNNSSGWNLDTEKNALRGSSVAPKEPEGIRVTGKGKVTKSSTQQFPPIISF
jgi:hypothetical protein